MSLQHGGVALSAVAGQQESSDLETFFKTFVCRVYIFPHMLVWVFSRHTCFLPQSRDMQVKLGSDFMSFKILTNKSHKEETQVR